MVWPDGWDHCAVASARVDEAEVRTLILGPLENGKLQSLGSDIRRNDWRAGRMAARRALRTLAGTQIQDLNSISILADAEGAPQVWFGDGTRAPYGVSLTHGGGEAYALAWRESDWTAGIDWVSLSDRGRTRSVMSRWARPEEAEWLRWEHGPCLLWGVREALSKATRTGMFVFGLSRVHVHGVERDRVLTNWPEAEIRWREVPGTGILVVARVPPSIRNEARDLATAAMTAVRSP
ncbi:MAG: hypothetical protein ACFB9M_10420 [Myxococcota bacterium]